MYSMNNEGKSVVGKIFETFIRTLKNEIYKYMTSVSENVSIDQLDDIVNKYNNIYHSIIKIKPVDVKSNTSSDSSKEIIDKNPEFKIGDNIRISKYENVFAKVYTPNWSGEVFVIENFENAVPWTYVINDVNAEEIDGTFYENELQKANQKQFRIEKVIKRKGDKLYIKWKGYNNLFNSWIDKKDVV